MQTTWSQTTQTHKNVTPVSFCSLTFFLLPVTLASFVGLSVFVYLLISGISKKRRLRSKKMSRAECLVGMVDVMNGTNFPIREKMKRIGRMLAQEGDPCGWRCRIVLENDPSFLPPMGKNLGIHFPLMAGEVQVGTLIVTSTQADFDEVDRIFFSSLARSLGLFIYKENMWVDFHSEVERLQASLLLNQISSPDDISPMDHSTVEHMLRRLGHLKGKVENPIVNKL